MNPKQNLYRIFGRFATGRYRRFIEENLRYSGMKIPLGDYLGQINLLGFLVFIMPILVSYLSFKKIQLIYLISGIVLFSGVHFIGYLIIYFKTEERKSKIENSLPDMLYLIAANMKSGMSPYNALKSSALEQFGPLKDEIEHAIALANSGKSLADSLLGISRHVKSETLSRTLRIFTNAIKSGARMSSLLEELANDISETRNLKRELVMNTKTYSLFIMFIIIIGAPLLMAISIHLFDVISGIQSSTLPSVSDNYGMNAFLGKTTITRQFLMSISITMLVITGILSSMLLGVIKEGKMLYGMKYSPVVIIPSVILFYLVIYWVGNVI